MNVLRRQARILTTNRLLSRQLVAHESTVTASTSSEVDRESERWLFIDSIFPARLGIWDFRHYIGKMREDALLAHVSNLLSTCKDYDFKVLSLEPHYKDGGVLVRFTHSGGRESAEDIEAKLNEAAAKQGGLPSWLGLTGNRGEIWLVKGSLWREDMGRFPSPVIKVQFEGPDVHEEKLYSILRPFGKIGDITPPTPPPAGLPRSATVMFHRIRSATIARNVVHGLTVDGTTRIRTTYEQPIKAHVIRDWVSNHPRIVLPVMFFLLGTITYTIFDPIRAFMIEGKLQGWFDFRTFNAYKWIQRNALDRIEGRHSNNSSDGDMRPDGTWKDRKQAQTDLKTYLNDVPATLAFVHGPQGSGKTRMLTTLLSELDRKTLTVDCAELHKAGSDGELVGALAKQTGYRPVFTFMNSMNNLIDLASVGLIGQKTGLSTSITDQLKSILAVTTTALKRTSASHEIAIKRRVKEQEREAQEAARREHMMRGTWRDGRLDCVAGNGVMSELGGGDEPLQESDYDGNGAYILTDKENAEEEKKELEKRRQGAEYAEGVKGLPIVVIKNFTPRTGAVGNEEVMNVLSEWVAGLVEDQVAHVVVVSENRENVKSLAKALPSKPLTTIALSDADKQSSLAYVEQKLRAADIPVSNSSQAIEAIERLGGRASDLESLIHKVRHGASIEDAVEDIIQCGIGKLRKNAFGDDAEDAKNLPWAPEQAWAIFKRLAKDSEIPYHDVLLDFPFKGDETPLRSMEKSELISITTVNSRPSTIRPGKPIYRYVFQRLSSDPIFRATQEIAFNEKAIAGAEKIISTCESELTILRDISEQERKMGWFGIGRGASDTRAKFLLEKMRAAEVKVEHLDKVNTDLKKVLKKGG